MWKVISVWGMYEEIFGPVQFHQICCLPNTSAKTRVCRPQWCLGLSDNSTKSEGWELRPALLPTLQFKFTPACSVESAFYVISDLLKTSKRWLTFHHLSHGQLLPIAELKQRKRLVLRGAMGGTRKKGKDSFVVFAKTSLCLILHKKILELFFKN